MRLSRVFVLREGRAHIAPNKLGFIFHHPSLADGSMFDAPKLTPITHSLNIFMDGAVIRTGKLTLRSGQHGVWDFRPDPSVDPDGKGVCTIYDLGDLDAGKLLTADITRIMMRRVRNTQPEELDDLGEVGKFLVTDEYNDAPEMYRVWSSWHGEDEPEHLIGPDSPENER